jgi:hypothetical protein
MKGNETQGEREPEMIGKDKWKGEEEVGLLAGGRGQL